MPTIYVIAGANGAGKSTMAQTILSEEFRCAEFVNADVIARGLSAFNPEGAALEAGRVMLQRLNELARQRVDFAFETTLASLTFAPWLRKRQSEGYQFHLFLHGFLILIWPSSGWLRA
jgi:predicted ABC-type ATPase